MRRSQTFAVLLVAALLGAAFPAQAGATTKALSLQDAEALLTKRCSGCHNLEPNTAAALANPSERTAPDLSFAGNKFRREWLFLWLQAPTRLRPAGHFYADHIRPTESWDEVNDMSTARHPVLKPVEAVAVVEALLARKGRSDLLKGVTLQKTALSMILGDLLFEKAKGCIACHQSAPDYGGVSGAELYTAYARLQPEYIYSYIRNPQAWEPGIWMPNLGLSDVDLNKLVRYLEMIVVAPEFHRRRDTSRQAAVNYRTYCYQCHGMKGDGSGVNVRDMAVKPRDHTDSVGMSKLTDERIFNAIKGGGASVGKSALMPAWGGVFTDEEIRSLVAFLRTLCNCKGPESP